MKNSKKRTKIYVEDSIWILFGIVFITLSGRCSWDIKLSTVDIPITLQSLVIISLNMLFPRWYGLFSVLIWLVLAWWGWPLLADGNGGIDWMQDKSAGYLLGFVLSGYILNSIPMKHRISSSFSLILKGQFIATLIILFIGWIVLSRHIGVVDAYISTVCYRF